MCGGTTAEVGDLDTRGRIVREGLGEVLEEDFGILEEGDAGLVGGEDSDSDNGVMGTSSGSKDAEVVADRGAGTREDGERKGKSS